MKTLFGHIASIKFPSLGRFHQRFVQVLERTTRHTSKPWNAVIPFVPLRQPLGGHGNPRKEHPAPHRAISK